MSEDTTAHLRRIIYRLMRGDHYVDDPALPNEGYLDGALLEDIWEEHYVP